jgi:diphthamide biosynthesis protein 4
MDAGRHLVGCESCSEVVWVGYEPANDEHHATNG